MTTTKTRKEIAIEYANKGWGVFPLEGKRPLTPNGVKNATDSLTKINNWWATWPNANIGIAAGEDSDLFIVDIDGDEGKATWAELTTHFGDVDTYTVQTGKGLHLYFKYVDTPGFGNNVKLLDGIDIRTTGGYVVGAGSIHPETGAVYTVINDTEPAHVPHWLLTTFAEARKKGKKASNGNGHGQTPANVAEYVKKAFQNEIEAVRSAGEGGRNDQLNRSAFSLGTFVGAGQLDQTLVEKALEDACQFNGLAKDDGIEQCRKTIASGVSAGAKNPRDLSNVGQKAIANGLRVSESDTEPLDTLLTEAGNAKQFERDNAGHVYYATGRGWVRWNGKHFEDDAEEAYAMRQMRKIAYSWYERGVTATKEDHKFEAEAMKRFSRASLSTKMLKASLAQAKIAEGILTDAGRFDTDPMLLNTQNGIVDLKTGELKPHEPAMMMSKICNASYNPNAGAPMWDKFLNDAFLGKKDVIDFVRRWLGYCLTGKTDEQKYVIAWGEGGNGKTTLFGIMEWLLGSYALKMDSSTITAKRDKSEVNPGLAQVPGARMIICTEWNDTARPDETLLKDLTGKETIKTRTLYQTPFSFMPQCKINIFGNDRPDIHGTDTATWRRPLLVPFEADFNGPNRIRDMDKRLEAEADGILADLVRGCLEWQQQGLNPPNEIIEATKGYREDQDDVAQFIADYCEVIDQGRISVETFFKAYQHFGGRGFKDKLGKQMKSKGFKSSPHPKFGRQYHGLKLKDEVEQAIRRDVGGVAYQVGE